MDAARQEIIISTEIASSLIKAALEGNDKFAATCAKNNITKANVNNVFYQEVEDEGAKEAGAGSEGHLQGEKLI